MRKKYLLLTILSFSSIGFSQITINSIHMPVVNDTLRVSRAQLDLGIDYQTTGPNQTWDFSSLQNNNQKLNTYSPVSASGSLTQLLFGTFASTKYKASYFLPNEDLPLNNLPPVLPITFSDINQFIKNAPAAMTLVGLSMKINGQAIPAKADTIETKYSFPLNYGGTHTSRSYINLDLNPIYDAQWRQHRKRETEVDGWGEITTPYGTFPVLRIHHRIEESDSFKIAIGPFSNWIGIPVPVSHEYEWRTTTEKEPILFIRTTELLGNEVVSRIEYRNDFVLGVKENAALNFEVYPNPATTHLTIDAQSGMDSYHIISMDGRVVQSGILNGTIQIIDVQALETGSYFLNVVASGQMGRKHFVKN
ncbi:MAG: T9SS type A sorting domain-containing protein [Crocinitomicaceae bacterium]|nr:T9SS type A sorting domain-containing protein [Crocinitomicaceae bacterium]